MREHPIPQDIVGYRFHIIGSMTLKQFAELAAGSILGLIIHATNLPDIIKWPLIFITVSLGAAAAFLPIAERPLDHWIITFFKILHQPTKFFWKKSAKIPDLFLFKAGQKNLEAQDELDLTPARRQRIKEYLTSTRSGMHGYDQNDLNLQSRIQNIMQSFNDITPVQVEATKQRNKPNLKVRTRSLVGSAISKDKAVAYNQTTKSKKKSALAITQVATSLSIPEAESTEVGAHQGLEKVNNQTTEQQAVYIENNLVNESKTTDDQAVTFNVALPFPSKPTRPNKLVGMILTNNNELIPEAIIEIKDDENRVVRAVKSNALGQFFISTPLKSGNYSISINHDQYQFHPQEIMLEGEVVDPIEIRSLG
ncbi:MAG: hypothetical protein ABIJ22_00400 [Patescibacteria group bacterium]